MSNYTSPFKRSCIHCGVAVSVCSFLGRQVRIPACKASVSPIHSDLEEKRTSPSQRARQLAKSKTVPRKRSSKGIKKRPNPIIKGLAQKLKSAEKQPQGSSEPLFKSVILREMMRLGRRPSAKFRKAAMSVNYCVPERSYEAGKLPENPFCPVHEQPGREFESGIMEMNVTPRTTSSSFETEVQLCDLHKIGTSKEFESDIEMNEAPRTTSSESEVEIYDQNRAHQLENFDHEMEITETPQQILDEVDLLSNDKAVETNLLSV
ncbi:uncharacterized protein LOC128263055 [Drosophila gunungcola]|uniref:uncharacterized protein LOC128263055 n=1 Tax=Drosophila gunungcola TaxID=103775 RepID=UPI0022E6DEFA|nr:uncharacterized protein LOC128263055 [Drosophila gunungcola]